MDLKSGRVEGIPYSLSRWTDVPAAKWPSMMEAFRAGEMIAFDPRNAIPYRWSLRPDDTLGLVFWTKDPTNLIAEAALIRQYRYKIHITLTGWVEAEKGAPTLDGGAELLSLAAETFGGTHVEWRFSPVPLLPPSEVLERFERIARQVGPAGINRVYLSFLQTNDLVTETRDERDRLNLMGRLASVASHYGIKVLLCNEDRTLSGLVEPPNLSSGICAPPEDFELPGAAKSPSEGCGCVLMADPFTVNETCTFGCSYCYAADKTLAPKKRNTTPATRSLPVVR